MRACKQRRRNRNSPRKDSPRRRIRFCLFSLPPSLFSLSFSLLSFFLSLCLFPFLLLCPLYVREYVGNIKFSLFPFLSVSLFLSSCLPLFLRRFSCKCNSSDSESQRVYSEIGFRDMYFSRYMVTFIGTFNLAQ